MRSRIIKLWKEFLRKRLLSDFPLHFNRFDLVIVVRQFSKFHQRQKYSIFRRKKKEFFNNERNIDVGDKKIDRNGF